MKRNRLMLSLVLAFVASHPVPSAAAARPPTPKVVAADTTITASYVDRCMRRNNECRLDDKFEQTELLEVRPGIRLVVDTGASVRTLQVTLDCRHRDPRRVTADGRRWVVRIKPPNGRPRGGRMCSAGSLVIAYAEGRTSRARYTFSAIEDPHARRCRPRGWQAVVENPFARVYSVPDPDAGRGYYVCRFETGTARWFGQDLTADDPYGTDQSVDADATRLTNQKTAYVLIEADSRYEPRERQSLVVRDVVSWDVEHEIQAGHHWGADFGAPGDEYGFTDVALKENGAVAWIVAKGPYGDRSSEVRKTDATGEYVLLDSGAGIDRASLTLDGSTLRWLNAGEPRAASLD
jgi:hypothetical protein